MAGLANKSPGPKVMPRGLENGPTHPSLATWRSADEGRRLRAMARRAPCRFRWSRSWRGLQSRSFHARIPVSSPAPWANPEVRIIRSRSRPPYVGYLLLAEPRGSSRSSAEAGTHAGDDAGRTATSTFVEGLRLISDTALQHCSGWSWRWVMRMVLACRQSRRNQRRSPRMKLGGCRTCPLRSVLAPVFRRRRRLDGRGILWQPVISHDACLQRARVFSCFSLGRIGGRLKLYTQWHSFAFKEASRRLVGETGAVTMGGMGERSSCDLPFHRPESRPC